LLSRALDDLARFAKNIVDHGLRIDGIEPVKMLTTLLLGLMLERDDLGGAWVKRRSCAARSRI
jgi:hypothetical protein